MSGRAIRAACAAALVSLCAVAGLAKETVETDGVRLQSAYLATPLEIAGGEVHRITLTADLSGGAGKLVLDPNSCQLGDFGDPMGCTQIALRSYEVVLRPTRTADPLRLGRHLYLVEGKGLPRMFVVAPAGGNAAYRIVLPSDEPSDGQVVTLEPAGPETLVARD